MDTVPVTMGICGRGSGNGCGILDRGPAPVAPADVARAPPGPGARTAKGWLPWPFTCMPPTPTGIAIGKVPPPELSGIAVTVVVPIGAGGGMPPKPPVLGPVPPGPKVPMLPMVPIGPMGAKPPMVGATAAPVVDSVGGELDPPPPRLLFFFVRRW